MSLSKSLPGQINPAERAFDTTIDSLIATIEFVDLAEKVRPRVGKVLHWEAVDGDLRSLIDRYIDSKDSYCQQVLSSTLVVAYGAFEQFCRRCMEIIVDAVSMNTADVAHLPTQVLTENVYRTGRALLSVKFPRPFFDADYIQLARNLSTCASGQKNFSLNATVFAVEIGVLSKKGLDDFFKRIGIEIPWNDIAKLQGIKDSLGATGASDSRKLLEEWLDKFSSSRNVIAHTGTSSEALTTDSAINTLRFLRTFSGALSAALVRVAARKFSR